MKAAVNALSNSHRKKTIILRNVTRGPFGRPLESKVGLCKCT
jgi:hypothetical protein